MVSTLNTRYKKSPYKTLDRALETWVGLWTPNAPRNLKRFPPGAINPAAELRCHMVSAPQRIKFLKVVGY